ncbi:MAG: hypothetical protein IJT73_02825 [Selenomonadaceae bacterium]|nr:hypothetical protein [Selenomonadaceae bacterium]
MDFTGIGKIGNFAKQKNLVFAANYRIKTGQSLTDGNGNLNFTKAVLFSQTKTSKSSSTSMADAARMAAIKQKLRSGKKLSAAEMSYLKEKDPSTYKKAKYADDTREELKNELKQATTKQEAREAVMRAMAKIAADCTADFESLKANAGGGISFGGADMNFGGETNMNVGGGEVAVDGGEVAVDGGEISNVETSENVDAATSENVDANTAENSVTQNETVAQDSTSQTGNENSETAQDILDKYIYAIRAVQNEWLEFIKSDKYKKLPENILEQAEMLIHGGKKDENKYSAAHAIEAIMAYRAAMGY